MKRIILISLLFTLTCQMIWMFNINFGLSLRSPTKLYMGGGRSLAEKNLSKRQMFRQIRDKLNESAKAPGFFESNQGHSEIELFCKSNKDGTQIGDCPFAQFIQLVLIKKGLAYDVRPTLSSNKPEFIVNQHEGKLPVLVHKGKSMTDSLQIAEFIEKTYPHSSLTRQGAFSYQEVIEKTSNFFPALKALITNKDPARDSVLLTDMENELDKLDEIIRSTPGQYVCGIEQTLADLYLIPQLFHAMVTLEHFKGVELYQIGGEAKRPALENYIERFLSSEEFNDKRAYYNVDQVIFGWKIARGEA